VTNGTVYIEYEFFATSEARRDAIISILPEVGFDGFEELNDSIKAFIPEDLCDHGAIFDTLREHGLNDIDFQYTTILPKNWNEEWEKNFEPLLIAGRVSIRAPFHERQPADYELVIEPKMSFGTGHHATTAMMIQQMLELDMSGRAAVDFGSGTGILAILAERLGASSVLAIDHEDWAIENSRENIRRNNAVKVAVKQADSMDSTAGKYDIMLANINRHIIMKYLQSWRNFISPGGVLVVSGILEADREDVCRLAAQSGFGAEKVLAESGWVSILFKSN
jgi:ribosomal protein L11 methyltransferase